MFLHLFQKVHPLFCTSTWAMNTPDLDNPDEKLKLAKMGSLNTSCQLFWHTLCEPVFLVCLIVLKSNECFVFKDPDGFFGVHHIRIRCIYTNLSIDLNLRCSVSCHNYCCIVVVVNRCQTRRFDLRRRRGLSAETEIHAAGWHSTDESPRKVDMV